MKISYRTKHYQVIEVIGIVAFVLVILVQQFIRPNSQNYAESIKHLLGVMPNLFGGMAICIAIFIHGKTTFDKYNLSPEKAMMLSAFLTILGLIIWEYVQIIAHRHFYLNDVLASILGSFISSAFIYFNIRYNKKKNRIGY